MYNNYYNQPTKMPPMQNNNYNPNFYNDQSSKNQNKKTTGISIAAFVLGLVGLLTSCFFIGSLFCIISLIFAIIDLGKKDVSHGLSITSLVLSIIGLLCTIFYVICILVPIIIVGQSTGDVTTYPKNYYDDYKDGYYNDYDYFDDDDDEKEYDAGTSL